MSLSINATIKFSGLWKTDTIYPYNPAKPARKLNMRDYMST